MFKSMTHSFGVLLSIISRTSIVRPHQLQLLHQFDELGMICACYDTTDLEKYVVDIKKMTFRPYVSNTHVIMDSIEDYLCTLEK